VHQVGDETKVILRCTVNQPSRFVLLDSWFVVLTLWMITKLF